MSFSGHLKNCNIKYYWVGFKFRKKIFGLGLKEVIDFYFPACFPAIAAHMVSICEDSRF